jgi:cytoskeleton protein RodZ
MTDSADSADSASSTGSASSNDSVPPATAGALLRAARERQGLHIAALAASIKVSPRKLDALEHDRYGELPDATFTRALAQTICRSLKIDPQPVLALLPTADVSALDHVPGSLNAPFRERPGRGEPAAMAVAAIRPMVWAGLALLAAAVAVYFAPSTLWQAAPQTPTPAPLAVSASPPASEPVAPASAAEGVAALAGAASAVARAPDAASLSAVVPAPSAPPAGASAVAAAPKRPAPASSPQPLAAAATSLVQLSTDEASWVEVRDGRGQVLLSRTVQPGESLGFDGALPIRMTIGNAPATRLSFRGKPVNLAASTRDNVARLELQ